MSDKTIKADTVAGIEKFRPALDPDRCLHAHEGELGKCQHCGHEAAYRRHRDNGAWQWSVECSNTSCAIQTPPHYATKEAAAKAWNRRP